MIKKKRESQNAKKHIFKKIQARKNQPKKIKKNLKEANSILNPQLESLQIKVKDLEKELIQKNTLIKKYDKQFEKVNKVILKLTMQVDSDLDKLYKLHSNLIPTKFPTTPNCDFSFKFVPSLKANGKDYYGVIPIKKMQFSLVMSSCISHILSSLLISSRIKLMSYSDIRTSQPADFLQLLLKEIENQKKMISDRLEVDIFYAIMNLKTYKLSYCSLGKINGFLYTHSSKELQPLLASTSSLKKAMNHKFDSKKVNCNPKDCLVICSPGVLSTKNKEGEEFGKMRLKEVILNHVEKLGPHYLRNKIMYALKSHSNGRPIDRDQSVIVMRIKDRILKLA